MVGFITSADNRSDFCNRFPVKLTSLSSSEIFLLYVLGKATVCEWLSRIISIYAKLHLPGVRFCAVLTHLCQCQARSSHLCLVGVR